MVVNMVMNTQLRHTPQINIKMVLKPHIKRRFIAKATFPPL